MVLQEDILTLNRDNIELPLYFKEMIVSYDQIQNKDDILNFNVWAAQNHHRTIKNKESFEYDKSNWKDTCSGTQNCSYHIKSSQSQKKYTNLENLLRP